MLTGLLRRVSGSTVSLTGADGVKFTRQLLPGDRVEVRLENPRAGGSVRFEIRSNEALVSRGTVQIAEGAGG